jgi:hypothetical protein
MPVFFACYLNFEVRWPLGAISSVICLTSNNLAHGSSLDSTHLSFYQIGRSRVFLGLWTSLYEITSVHLSV